MLGWLLIAPSQVPCRTEAGTCLGGVEGIEGFDPCSSGYVPTCETFFGSATEGPAYPFVPAFVGLLIGGVINLVVMAALKRGIWGEKEG